MSSGKKAKSDTDSSLLPEKDEVEQSPGGSQQLGREIRPDKKHKRVAPASADKKKKHKQAAPASVSPPAPAPALDSALPTADQAPTALPPLAANQPPPVAASAPAALAAESGFGAEASSDKKHERAASASSDKKHKQAAPASISPPFFEPPQAPALISALLTGNQAPTALPPSAAASASTTDDFAKKPVPSWLASIKLGQFAKPLEQKDLDMDDLDYLQKEMDLKFLKRLCKKIRMNEVQVRKLLDKVKTFRPNFSTAVSESGESGAVDLASLSSLKTDTTASQRMLSPAASSSAAPLPAEPAGQSPAAKKYSVFDLSQDVTIGVFRMMFVLWPSRGTGYGACGSASVGLAALEQARNDVKCAIAYATTTCRAIRDLLSDEVAEVRDAYMVVRHIVAKHADFDKTGLQLDTKDAVLLASTKFFRYVHSFHTSNGQHRQATDPKLGERGFVAIAGALGANTTLKHLCLDANDIYQGSDAGIAAIADMLGRNKTLETLILSYQCLGPNGGVLLGHALAKNATLRTLGLRQACVYDSGAITVANALKQNTTLTSLNLDKTDIGHDGYAALVDALEQNTALRSVRLQDLPSGFKERFTAWYRSR